jgi:hypothetical protein
MGMETRTDYLSQIALCIELGLKSIIVNTDDFYHTHDLEDGRTWGIRPCRAGSTLKE